jgi:hypothetical protein
VTLSRIQVPYPQYKFQYTSAGGNTGHETNIQLNSPTLDALAEHSWRRSGGRSPPPVSALS